MRTLTLVVKIPDQAKADWIWAAHLKPEGENGVIVDVIANGDQVTVPGKIVEELAYSEPDHDSIERLVKVAENHMQTGHR